MNILNVLYKRFGIYPLSEYNICNRDTVRLLMNRKDCYYLIYINRNHL